METVIIRNESGIAPEIIKNGGLVAVPTETVYGLAASGLNSDAVSKIYEVKNRPEVKPISLLVSGMEAVEKFCKDIPKEAYTMAEKFWPGPLTMILWRKPTVPYIVTSGGETVGVRCPDHEVTLDIIRKAGVPLAAPSANLSGCPSPKNIEQVLKYFDGKIECAVDGGECSVGIESTIVDMTRKPFKILRMGGLSRETIFEEAGIETV
ncbi:MAG: threonylcarbamoyl-AMP synthase [Ruminococcaceae bacterium]|nr:threonylcarbamoyl-AMP synthase [Oscillospiraceae bacterium]